MDIIHDLLSWLNVEEQMMHLSLIYEKHVIHKLPNDSVFIIPKIQTRSFVCCR